MSPTGELYVCGWAEHTQLAYELCPLPKDETPIETDEGTPIHYGARALEAAGWLHISRRGAMYIVRATLPETEAQARVLMSWDVPCSYPMPGTIVY